MKKPLTVISPILAGVLAMSLANPLLAHVGHGDEFQAEGGIERVQVNPQTDQMLGIIVTPISPATDGSAAVMVPVSALVDADGKPLVFVQYENFYEPVFIKTGATQGEFIQVTEGLSVGEQLVTQGSLSLYAESRKTQAANVTASPSAIASPQTNATHAQADAQGIPHSHDTSGNMVEQSTETTPETNKFPMGILAAIGGSAALLVGGIVVMGNRKKGGF